MLDTLLVIVVIGCALAYLGRRTYRSFIAPQKAESSCGSCPNCPTQES